MKFITAAALVCAVTWAAGSAGKVRAAEADHKENSEVFVNHGSVVLMEQDKTTKFITPKELLAHGRFEIRIKRPKPVEAQPEVIPAPTLSERIEARRIMHEANQAYFSGDIAKSWDLIAQAEKLDPDFYRIKTMKGSLLYKIGSTDLAVEIWTESLAQNPDQPEIVHTIESLKKGGEAGPAIAKGAATDNKKALQ
jgi:hypothetical protein